MNTVADAIENPATQPAPPVRTMSRIGAMLSSIFSFTRLEVGGFGMTTVAHHNIYPQSDHCASIFLVAIEQHPKPISNIWSIGCVSCPKPAFTRGWTERRDKTQC
jgi:hypothetical protein